ncbi:hypothetical protein K402DRAFT_362713, partial [Aulographum hederae CBS 113979]
MSSQPNITCPDGGSFYACTTGAQFVGCCASNPCTSATNGCSAGLLRKMSFNPEQYGRIPDQQCSAGLWYMCSTIDPPF